MTRPFENKVEKSDWWNFVYVITAVVVALAVGYFNKRETDTKISGLAGCIMRGNDWQNETDKRLDRLEQRVYFPLFTAHCKTCQQCSGQWETEDGPPALCEDGFKLFKQDMENNK